MTVNKFLLISSLAFTFVAKASDGAPIGGDKEKSFQLLCVPESERNLPEEEAKQALLYRTAFHNFLRNPEPVISAYREAVKEDNGMLETLAATISVAINCGMTDLVKKEAATRGCLDESSQNVDITKAAQLCEAALQELKEQK